MLNRNELLEKQLELAGTTREKVAITTGAYYAGETSRNAVPINNTSYTVVSTGSKPVTIEDLVILLNFSAISDGRFDYVLRAYVEGSNKNTFTTSGGFAGALGTPLNCNLVNQVSEATVAGGVSATVTGDYDFSIYYASVYIDTSGNRESITETRNSFFMGDRKIIVPANTKFLFEAITSGDATGTVDITTQFFTIED